jgi:hypothetical protein
MFTTNLSSLKLPFEPLLIFFCISFGIAFIAARLLYTRFVHLRGIPGPYWAPFTRAWLLKTLASENAAHIYEKVNLEHGITVTIFPETLMILLLTLERTPR